MAASSPQIDRYIESAADFAKPILRHIRQLVHKACPDVEETLKWRNPTFMYKGMLCGMAAFKKHCIFGFWKHELLFDKAGKPIAEGKQRIPDRITSVKELPDDDAMIGYIKAAIRLNEEGVKLPSRSKPKAKKELVVPDYLSAALRKNESAGATFEKFSPSHKKEYVEWLTDAKTEETRQRRLATALEWLAEGKPRNWKYMNC
jgi:uncharacterized protein YdeI (YjbR/CyaY-like superfamily)